VLKLQNTSNHETSGNASVVLTLIIPELTKLKGEIKISHKERSFMKFLILILVSLSSIAHADQAQVKPLRYATLRGSINKIIIENKTNELSVKAALTPKTEKVCDISVKIPVYGSADGELINSSTCSTTFGGKSVSIFLSSRMYNASAKNSKAGNKKGADLILFVQSPLLEANSFSAGTDASMDAPQMSLRLNTPTYINNVNSRKTQESFSVDVSYDDPSK
jgi:hypothetical protein